MEGIALEVVDSGDPGQLRSTDGPGRHHHELRRDPIAAVRRDDPPGRVVCLATGYWIVPIIISFSRFIANWLSYFVSLPSVYIAAHVDYMRTVRILPRGPEETEIQVEWLLPPQTISDPDFDISGIVDFPILVMDQDARASELNQRGIRSKRFEQGVLMPEEHYVKAFQDWVRENLD